MWRASVYLTDGREFTFDVSAETAAHARKEAEAELVEELGMDEDKPWLIEPLIQAVVLGRTE